MNVVATTIFHQLLAKFLSWTNRFHITFMIQASCQHTKMVFLPSVISYKSPTCIYVCQIQHLAIDDLKWCKINHFHDDIKFDGSIKTSNDLTILWLGSCNFNFSLSSTPWFSSFLFLLMSSVISFQDPYSIWYFNKIYF